jgi:hypothetical protein
MEKLRATAEGCISKFWLLMRRDRNVPPIGSIVFLRLSAKVRLFSKICLVYRVLLGICGFEPDYNFGGGVMKWEDPQDLKLL